MTTATASRTAPARTSVPLILALAVLLGCAAAWAGLGTIREVLGRWDLGLVPNPYFLPDHALSLYVITPLASLGASLAFMAPGLILSGVWGQDKRLASWLISALAVSLVVLIGAVTVFQLATGIVLRGHAFLTFVIAIDIACLVVASLRLARGERWRIDLTDEGADIAISLAMFWLFLVLFAPKFYWENFSGDGSGSLQFTRLLVAKLWPFWMPEAGTIAKAPGLTSVLFVFPDSWFVRFIGETEYAVRVPHMLYLALLYPVLMALIRTGRDEAPVWAARLLIPAALYVYSLSVIYSGGYHPWFGDSPMPAVRETLAMACFMAFILFFIEGRLWLMAAAGIMAHLSIPTGAMWLLLWPAAVMVVWRPWPRDRLMAAAWVFAVALVISLVFPILIRLAGMPFPGGEFNAEAIVTRLRYVAFTDWNRFAFLAVPGGIVPALFLLAWPWQDRIAKALTLVTLAFFFFFYLQGYRVLLHHFIPAMIPPLVIFWRSDLLRRPGLGLVLKLAAVLGLGLSLWLAWPKEMRMHGHERVFGQSFQTEGPRFASATPADGERFRGFEPKALDTFHELLNRTFPQGYEDKSPLEVFYGAPLVWWYYSEFPKPEGQIVNYIIKPVADATPEDGTMIESYDDYGFFVRDMARYDQDRHTMPKADTGAAIFETKRSVIFGRGAKWGDRIVIDLVPMAKRMLGKSDK